MYWGPLLPGLSVSIQKTSAEVGEDGLPVVFPESIVTWELKSALRSRGDVTFVKFVLLF